MTETETLTDETTEDDDRTWCTTCDDTEDVTCPTCLGATCDCDRPDCATCADPSTECEDCDNQGKTLCPDCAY